MLWAVIMAGGVGTRFWPESRKSRPKQFLNLLSQKTLIEETAARLQGVIPRSRMIVVTQADKVGLVHRLLKLPKSQIIGEPVGRNTAPCVALAAAVIERRDPNAVLALLAADHRISKPAAFRRALRAASKIADEKRMPVTFGIRPAFAFTGYGYLEIEKRLGSVQGLPFYRLHRFHEKPDIKKARRFVKSRRFLWNSGMFVWRADDLLEATKTCLPRAYQLTQKMVRGKSVSGIRRHFPSMPNISIDYGIMEKLRGRILTVPADIGWNDVGGWRSLEELLPKNAEGNITNSQLITVNSSGNIVKSGDRLVALVGVSDMVVIDTPDALLVCSKAGTESIRKVVAKLKKKKLAKYL